MSETEQTAKPEGKGVWETIKSAFGAVVDFFTPGSDMPRPDSIVATAQVDTHQKAGQSDKPGDLKRGGGVYRHDGWVVGANADIITPQATKDGQMLDTATGTVTVGREQGNLGVYVEGGLINGAALDTAYKFVDWTHSVEGMGPSRKSPASSDEKVMLGVSGRYDMPVAETQIGPATVGIQTAFSGVASTQRTSGGVSAFAVIHDRNREFRPDLPYLPATDSSGSAVYVGVTAQGVVHDVATDKINTNPLQVSLDAGATYEVNPNFSVGVNYSHKLNNEIASPLTKPIDYVGVKATLKFDGL